MVSFHQRDLLYYPFFIYISEIIVAMNSSRYILKEDNGGLEVCVKILHGSLQRDAKVLLSTSPISTTGKI